MRHAVFYSAGLHVAVVMVAYLGLPALLSKPVVQEVALPVDLVSLEDVIKKPVRRPKPPPPKKAPPPPPPEAKPEPPPPPIAAPAPEPPPPPKAKPKPKLKKKAKPKPKPKKVPPVRRAKAAPKPKPKPKRPDQFKMLLKDLAKLKKEGQREQEKKPVVVLKPPPQVARRAPPVRSSIDQRLQAQRLTALVKKQLAPCWSIPAGAKDAYSVKVAVQIRLNPDGKLRGVPRVVDTNRMRTDPAFRAVADSAVRALHKCSPLKLPYDQYDLWKNITFNFDPSDALGQ
ncbi:MAG: hypothetical protein HOM58_17070 [Rhodospirillaceae bacterium]|jgi:outer membrane biosynthesis protein TonB|nr:hypothetical protein [Rhodospirillaceae bacterium]MBT5458984.1 hypothetical protein [Rhodospirillaceae bacterium]